MDGSTCLALLRSAALLAGEHSAAVLGLVCSAAYIRWPADRHLVQSLASPIILFLFVIVATTLRRLPLTAD